MGSLVAFEYCIKLHDSYQLLLLLLTRGPCDRPRVDEDLVGAHLTLASLTLTLGLARSSLNLWLCSVNLLSLSSAMDCLCGREGIISVGACI